MSPANDAAQGDPLGGFSLSEARRIVGEYFKPNPWIYWPDLLISWAVGMTAFALVQHPWWVVDNPAWHWPVRVVCFFVSSLLIYRTALFIHELVHIRDDQFRVFRFVWNLLCGIPFLIPSTVYYVHVDHHRRKYYGTKRDGEYISLARLPTRELWLYLAQIPVVPVLAIVRWGLLTPLTWFSTRLRDWVHEHASSMIMDPTFVRPIPSKRVLRVLRLQEFCCFVVVWFLGARMFMAFGLLASEPLPWTFLLQAYLTAVFIVGINAARTLGAHRWISEGAEMTFVEQMLDSVNYPNSPVIGVLWAPVGLRFHALHHLFPSMPYHALGKAHRRLIRELPADSPYRRCEADSLIGVLAGLWRAARRNDTTQEAQGVENKALGG